MKKILIASLMVAMGSAAYAANEDTALVAGANPIAVAGCSLLQNAVSINISAANIGNVDCDTTTANIGVAVANTSGKGKIFSIGSNGGALITTDSAAPVPTAAETVTESQARAATT